MSEFHAGLCCGCAVPRRSFLKGAAALTASAILPNMDLHAQAPGARRVDFHTHFAPPQWLTAMDKASDRGAPRNNNVFRAFKDWTPATSIGVMDQAGVATSMLSITTPGIWFTSKYSKVEDTRRLARDCNEFGMKMVKDYPGRFGLLAVLPMPDVEGSLKEIENALDTLKADGIGMLTHYGDEYGDGLLGNPTFKPVFDELNRRKAVVYVHRRISWGEYEVFGWDHYRTILSLINAPGRGQGLPSARYPDIRFVISHSGGIMPFVFMRTNTPQGAETKQEADTRNATLAVLRRNFHYDTAHSNNNFTQSALKKLIPASQILLGTDYPLTKTVQEVKGLEITGVWNANELRTITRENALSLIPRFS